MYLFFLRSSGLTTFIFFIPKEFSRRRIRHPAVGLGSWQCTQKNDLIVHYQVCKAPKVAVIRIVYRWLARTDIVYRVGVFVVAVTQCNSRHFMQQMHAHCRPVACLRSLLLALAFGAQGRGYTEPHTAQRPRAATAEPKAAQCFDAKMARAKLQVASGGGGEQRAALCVGLH